MRIIHLVCNSFSNVTVYHLWFRWWKISEQNSQIQNQSFATCCLTNGLIKAFKLRWKHRWTVSLWSFHASWSFIWYVMVNDLRPMHVFRFRVDKINEQNSRSIYSFDMRWRITWRFSSICFRLMNVNERDTDHSHSLITWSIFMWLCQKFHFEVTLIHEWMIGATCR